MHIGCCPGSQNGNPGSLRVFSKMKRYEVALFILSLILFSSTIRWGLPDTVPRTLPFTWAPDELASSGLLQEIMNSLVSRSGTYNPQYPLFGYLVAGIPAVPYYLMVGGLRSTRLHDLPVARMICYLARATTILMAAGTVVVACRTAVVLWGASGAWIVGLLTMLYPPMFYYGRTCNVDVPALFWTALGLWQFAIALREGLNNRIVWILGITAALAIATKDTSYGALLPVGVVIVWREWAQHRRLVLKGSVIFFIAYALASGALINPDRYRQHLHFIRYGSGQHFGFYYGSTTPYMQVMVLAARTIRENLGWAVLILALIGLAVCARTHRKLLLWALPAAGVVIFTVLPVRFVLYRFTIITGYCLIGFAALALWRIMQWKPTAGLVALAAVSGWTLLVDADFTWQMWNDSRYEAGRWFSRNAHPGDRIGYYGVDYEKFPFTDPRIGLELGPSSVPATNGPEFLIVFPYQSYETVHEHNLPQETYDALRRGDSGYKQLLGIQTRALFPATPGRFVNPPLKVFVREDRLATLVDRTPRIDLPD